MRIQIMLIIYLPSLTYAASSSCFCNQTRCGSNPNVLSLSSKKGINLSSGTYDSSCRMLLLSWTLNPFCNKKVLIKLLIVNLLFVHYKWEDNSEHLDTGWKSDLHIDLDYSVLQLCNYLSTVFISLPTVNGFNFTFKLSRKINLGS